MYIKLFSFAFNNFFFIISYMYKVYTLVKGSFLLFCRHVLTVFVRTFEKKYNLFEFL